VVFSGHVIQRMLERGIGRDDALAVIAQGETIAEYADDNRTRAGCFWGLREPGRCTSFWLLTTRPPSVSS